ncbi:MAG TPA: toxic anion resistance protein [Methanothrix sp.]|nr:toxic anion resistance protein [Methanothrix sp.]HPT36712.1 toxic anion resistance protein [Methanothrix sp.]
MAFTMQVPDEAEIKKEVMEQIKPVPEDLARIQEVADANAREIITLDIEELGNRKSILQSIESFGVGSMKSSATKNSLLQATVGSMSKEGDDDGLVAKGLIELDRELKELDPSLIDFTRKGILRKLFDPIKDYFARYQKADTVIANIIISLDKGEAILKNDNTSLEIEQQALRDLTKKLKKDVQLGTLMDESIERQIEAAKARNEVQEKIKFVTEEVLFPLRQRIMDMQQMIVVNQQGIIATEVVIRNNKELIRGVERAKNVTVSALKVAVMLANALYSQKIVLEKIEILNKTTTNIIRWTAEALKEQGSEIQTRSENANISPEDLNAAFDDAMEALESISTFKQEALPKMRETINQFRELAAKGEEQIVRLEKGQKLNQ